MFLYATEIATNKSRLDLYGMCEQKTDEAAFLKCKLQGPVGECKDHTHVVC
jgi:hypothetical protein